MSHSALSPSRYPVCVALAGAWPDLAPPASDQLPSALSRRAASSRHRPRGHLRSPARARVLSDLELTAELDEEQAQAIGEFLNARRPETAPPDRVGAGRLNRSVTLLALLSVWG